MATVERRTMVVDCDTHFRQSIRQWFPYVAERFKDPVARSWEERTKVSFRDALGSKEGAPELPVPDSDDPIRRLEWMDEEGIDASIIYPGLSALRFDLQDPDAAAGVCRALNRWSAEFASAATDRLKPCMVLPMRYPDKAVEELRYATQALGLNVAYVSPIPAPERRWSDPSLDPLWQEMQGSQVVLTFHEVTSAPSKDNPVMVARESYQGYYPFLYLCGHVVEMQLALMDIIGGGVLDRFPELQVGFVEAHLAWLPGWLALMDQLWPRLCSHKKEEAGTGDLSMTATEFFRRQCFITAFPDDVWMLEAARYVGEDNIVVCTDYPHPGTRYGMVSLLDQSYPDLSEDVRRKFLGGNAERIFRLNETGLPHPLVPRQADRIESREPRIQIQRVEGMAESRAQRIQNDRVNKTHQIATAAKDSCQEKLDAQAWVSDDCYRVLGKKVTVRTTSSEFAGQARRLFRSFSPTPANGDSPDLALSFLVAPPPESPSIRPFHFAYRGCTQIARTTDYWQLFRNLAWQLDLLLAEQTQDYYLLHSGAVARDRAGVLLPGASGSGKSSLTLALLREGYRYLSDELGAVDLTTGELHPFPMPIGIKDTCIFPELSQRQDFWIGPEPGENVGEEPVWYVHPEDVVPDCIGSPVPICYIIFPKYHPGTAPRLETLGAGQAMEQLLQNSVNFRRFGSIGFDLLAEMVKEAECLSLSFNDLDQATKLINGLTEGGQDPSAPLTR